MKNKIWAYLIHLSNHMWEDELSSPRGLYVPNQYTENNGTEIEIWDDTVKYLAECKYTHVLVDVGDAIKYETHPEISAPDAWDKDFTKKKLDEIRALGMTPVPKLNFSACHDTWLKEYSRMLSTKKYYEVASDVIREVAELFGSPELFHIGFDEEVAEYQSNYGIVTVRNGDLWWHDLNYVAKECEKWGARPWIWSDYAWDKKEIFKKNMSKSILQSNWFYMNFMDVTEEDLKNLHVQYKAIPTYLQLNEWGYDQVPTASTWDTGYTDNPYQTVAFGRDRLEGDHLLGYMTAPWMPTKDEAKHQLKNDAYKLYLARKKIYPETL